MDDYSGEVLAIERAARTGNTSLSSKRVIRTLERIIAERGMNKSVRTDNEPEFTSKQFELWYQEKQITGYYIQQQRPTVGKAYKKRLH